MPKLRAHNLSISLDGYFAGPSQSLEHPLGIRGEELHNWAFETRTARLMHDLEGGEDGLDDDFIASGNKDIGATIMGRNMFGPIRGPWNDDPWRGWWGANPPLHHPVFVLTHHPHPSLTMEGGTVFHFVADGIESALAHAFAAAEGRDVRIGGGASTFQQYLRAGLIDEFHLAMVPVFLGQGERLFDNLDGGPTGYKCIEFVNSPSVIHLRYAKG